jgi:GxxExxY protein
VLHGVLHLSNNIPDNFNDKQNCYIYKVSLKNRLLMPLLHEELTGSILNCAYKVHSALGPGLLESAYEECLYYELDKNGLAVVKQKPMPLVYDEIKLDLGYRIDLLIENKVIVEIKSADAINPVHFAQVMTYLKLTGCRIGLLINFNVQSLKDGIKRIII